jgi:hypothetical protein
MVVTYPQKRPNPLALKVSEWFIKAKDPLVAVYDAKKEEWEYK